MKPTSDLKALLVAAGGLALAAAALVRTLVIGTGGTAVPPQYLVAVLSFQVETVGGMLPWLTPTGARLERSYGPDVFDRPGPWRVALFNDSAAMPLATFGVRDPRLVAVAIPLERLRRATRCALGK